MEFTIKGSTYHPNSQEGLKKARHHSDKDQISIIFECEPTNVVDCNAIKVVCNILNERFIVGYIPKENIEQMTYCIDKELLVVAKLSAVVRKFAPPIKKYIYLGHLFVQLSGPCGSTNDKYVYNQIIK